MCKRKIAAQISNKSFLQNRLQLHCLNATLENRELLTWPSYIHDPLWHAGKTPHRHFMTSECRSNGTKVKLQDLCKVIKQEIFQKDSLYICFMWIYTHINIYCPMKCFFVYPSLEGNGSCGSVGFKSPG